MADLGTLPLVLENENVLIMPLWADSPFTPIGSNAIGVSGSITGVVKEGITNLNRAVVYLYYRPTGYLIAKVLTDQNGQFQFNGLDVNKNDYFVVALDPDGGTQYNALIYDRVTPE